MDEGIHGSEEDLVALLQGSVANGEGDVRLAGSGRADENEVVDALNPVEIGELLELPRGEALLEIGVEGIEVFESGDLRLLDSTLLRLLFAVGDFAAEAVKQELLV